MGAAFGPIAVKQEVTQPYKPSTWAQVPDWAKDKDGHWALAYTGTIAFIVNKKLLHGSEVPTSWADLQTGKYKVSVGDVSTAAQASNAVLAAAIANKGDEKTSHRACSFSPGSPSKVASRCPTRPSPPWKKAKSKLALSGTSTA